MSTTTAVNWTFWANMLESKRQEMTITCLKLRPTTNTTTTITYSHPTLTGTWSSGNLRRSRVPLERCKILSCRLRELEMLQQQEAMAFYGNYTDLAPTVFLSKIHEMLPAWNFHLYQKPFFLTTNRHPPVYILREWLSLREQNYRELNTHYRK